MNFENIPIREEELREFFTGYVKVSPLLFDNIMKSAKVIKQSNIQNIDNFSDINSIIDFIGCFKDIDKDSNIIKGYNLCLPQVINLRTLLINIHEITHTLITISNIGNEDSDDIYEECLPILFERLYISVFKKELLEYFNQYQLERLKSKQDKFF